MIKEKIFLNKPITFNEINIYPPTVNDVIDNNLFWQSFKVLTLSQEEIEDELIKENIEVFPNPLEFLLNNAYHNQSYQQLVREGFRIFSHTEITFMWNLKKILIGKIENEVQKIDSIDKLNFIDENNFFEFQNLIRESIGQKPIDPPNPNEDPRVKRIKAKARYRDKIKAKKGLGLNLLSCLAAICCMGIGLTPLNIGEISYASVGILMSSYQEKEKYDIDIRSLQAGADAKKIKPTYWIRNLD